MSLVLLQEVCEGSGGSVGVVATDGVEHRHPITHELVGSNLQLQSFRENRLGHRVQVL